MPVCMATLRSSLNPLARYETAYFERALSSTQKLDKYSKLGLVGLISVILLGFGFWLFDSSGSTTRFSGSVVGALYALAFHGVFLGAMIYGALGMFFHFVRQRYKGAIMPIFEEMLGWRFETVPSISVNLTPFKTYRLLPDQYEWAESKSQLSGLLGDVGFVTNDLVLTKRGNKNSRKTIFRGTVLMLQFPQSFRAETIVLKDRGIFNSEKIKKRRNVGQSIDALFAPQDENAEAIAARDAQTSYDRVNLVLPEFEKKFEAYSTDQVEARVLLSPEFIEQIVELEKTMDGRGLRFAFVRNKLFIVFEDPVMLDPRTFFSKLSNQNYAQALLDEVSAIITIAKWVKSRRSSFERKKRSRSAAVPEVDRLAS